MPQLYSTGPALIYADLNGPVFVGTCQRAPGISVRPHWTDVQNDLGGTVAFDVLYESQEAMVTGVINRYSETLYQIMADRASNVLPPVPGSNSSGEIGSLMLTEGLTYELWVVFPYSTKVFYSNPAPGFGAMPQGYHFFNAYLMGPDGNQIGTTTERKIQMTWRCLRTFDTSPDESGLAGDFNTGQFDLYNFDCSAVTSIPIT
jgi:hypothetical protein